MYKSGNKEGVSVSELREGQTRQKAKRIIVGDGECDDDDEGGVMQQMKEMSNLTVCALLSYHLNETLPFAIFPIQDCYCGF